MAAAAALSVTTLVQSVELRLNVLLGFPGYPGGTQLTSLLVELLRAEQQFVDSPVLAGQFLAATADLRARLANHIQNEKAPLRACWMPGAAASALRPGLPVVGPGFT
jgi:hypothetical protein